ncbi:3-hydroxyacyl-ACP dehydratase FabZ [bacterium]|nr:3-hydroxyacyl-ACP dehydratase FabZ [bacterium]
MTLDPAFTPPFGVEVIQKIIPHRYPFLLVDRITDMGEDYIAGIKNLTANEALFTGHFPAHAVFPGVLQIETMAQVGACWILSREENRGKIAYLMSVESAKFRRPAEPGDQLKVWGKITNLKSRTGKFISHIKVDEKVICECTLMFAFQKQNNDANGS